MANTGNTAAFRIADILSKNAGWHIGTPDSDGAFSFALEGELDFRIHSPDGRIVFLEADLGPCPPENSPEGEEMLRKIAESAVGATMRRSSVLSLAQARIQLHASLPLPIPNDRIIEVADSFLNDLSWWRRRIEELSRPASSSASPFSFFQFSQSVLPSTSLPGASTDRQTSSGMPTYFDPTIIYG